MRVAEAPEVHRMLPGLLLTVTVGTLFTVTFRVLVFVQPAVVPDTV